MAKSKVGGGWTLKGGPAQILPLTGVRINASAANETSTAAAALPAGAEDLIVVRSTQAIWIRFGTSGMGAAANGVDSILFPAGEAPLPLPQDATHFRVINAVTDADALVQLEGVKMLANA